MLAATLSRIVFTDNIEALILLLFGVLDCNS
jgi:hypothetical protein